MAVPTISPDATVVALALCLLAIALLRIGRDASQPLALPEGSVRALLAIMITSGLMAFYWRFQWAPGFLEGTAGAAIGYYFGTRKGEGGMSTPMNGTTNGTNGSKTGTPNPPPGA